MATTWEDARALRQDLERAGSSSSAPFRMKLLQAAATMKVRGLGVRVFGCDEHSNIVLLVTEYINTFKYFFSKLQDALGLQDLGQFHYKPIKDNNGTLVLVTVKNVRTTKLISNMNVKWIPRIKLKERKGSICK